MSLDNAINIDTYVADGFVKVCDVEADINGSWYYSNMNESVMFSSHRSWVYMIVVGKEVVKVGETGNPLGLRQKTSGQPKHGSEGRLGRYRSGDATDAFIRQALESEVCQNLVSIWARRCDMVKVSISIGGQEDETSTCFHKDLEMRYLDFIFSATKQLPRLNKARK
jgi:hypothetical protein